MNKFTYTLLLTIVSALVFTSCSDSESEYDASGTFEATEIIVSSEANGKIISLDIMEGDNIKENASYGLVDTVILDLQRQQIRASINATLKRIVNLKTQVAPIEDQIATQQREKVRVTNLIAAKAANTKQLDDVNSAITLFKSQLDATTAEIQRGNRVIKSEVIALETQIALIDDMIERCIISSPLNGVVLAKYAEQGEITAIGKPLFKVADIENMQIRAYITAGQLASIKLGQKATLYPDSGNNKDSEPLIYEGVITWISDEAEFTPKTIQPKDERANLVYAIKVSFINDGFVKMGMYGDIKFE